MKGNIFLPLLGIMLLGVFLRLYGISSQPPLSDEVGVVFSATHYMENGQFGPTMWYHPNLRNIVTYCVGEVFGYGPYALRGMSLLAGILSIPLIGILLYILTRNKAASLLASFLMSVEQVHITFSRQAIQETWTTFFFLLGVLFFVLYCRNGLVDSRYSSPCFRRGKLQQACPVLDTGNPDDLISLDSRWSLSRTPIRDGNDNYGSGYAFLILSGIAFGLGMASKFHALFPLITCLFAGLYLSRKERSFSKGVFIFSCLIFIPAIVYLLTFLPWFGRGYGIMDWIEMQKVLLLKMASHKGNPMDQVIDTEAWQWFLRPMGYANFVYLEGKPFVTVAFSNPFVWLLVLPSTAFILWRHITMSLRAPNQVRDEAISKACPEQSERDEIPRFARNDTQQGILFLVILFIASYLPLAISTRPIWLLSSLATIPFAFMIVAIAFSQWSKTIRWGKKALIGYIVLVFLSSLAFYPMAIGKGKFYGYLNIIVERFRPPFEKM